MTSSIDGSLFVFFNDHKYKRPFFEEITKKMEKTLILFIYVLCISKLKIKSRK